MRCKLAVPMAVAVALLTGCALYDQTLGTANDFKNLFSPRNNGPVQLEGSSEIGLKTSYGAAKQIWNFVRDQENCPTGIASIGREAFQKSPDFQKNSAGDIVAGSISEVWTARGCDKLFPFLVEVVARGDGKTDTTVHPAFEDGRVVGQPVKPGQSFSGELVNVRAPDSGGWIITQVVGKRGLAFGKRGAQKDETYAATALVTKMPPTSGKEEFISAIKKRIIDANPPPRFQVIDADDRYSEDRGYPCVDTRIHFEDNAAVTPDGTQKLVLQTISRYCRYPNQADALFLVSYSHRGAQPDDQLEAAAQRFFAGVTLPTAGAQPDRKP